MGTVLDSAGSPESVTVKLSLKITSVLIQLESDSSSKGFFSTKLYSSDPSGPSGTISKNSFLGFLFETYEVAIESSGESIYIKT